MAETGGNKRKGAKHGESWGLFDANYANCREWELEFALIREIRVKACSRGSRFIPTAVSKFNRSQVLANLFLRLPRDIKRGIRLVGHKKSSIS